MYGGLRHNFVSSRDLFLNVDRENDKKTTYATTQSIDRKYRPEVGADPWMKILDFYSRITFCFHLAPK